MKYVARLLWMILGACLMFLVVVGFFLFHPPYPSCGVGRVVFYQQGESRGRIVTTQVTQQGSTLHECTTVRPKQVLSFL